MAQNSASSSPVAAVDEVVNCFKASVKTGQNWFLALLEAIKNWPVSEESYDGQNYNYVIAGEALDMPQIAERLLTAAGELVPEEEKLDFLFHNKPPLQLSMEKTQELMGELRLGQYLNFFYGIVVEEALMQTVEEEVQKEEQGLKTCNEAEAIDEAYRRIYENTQRTLLRQFLKEMGYTASRSMTLKQLKEFRYWRFKYRLKHCDKARIASDTKKALAWMKRNNIK
ncbi:MAG: hypothetical protein FWD30_04195 [Dehalococcoidia bacterium]|nr:hypothetical protein [Dehalococcoidia bacterium]